MTFNDPIGEEMHLTDFLLKLRESHKKFEPNQAEKNYQFNS
jgi:hypothetical protein